MSRVLVLYGSSEGQTAKVARAIAARLTADAIDAELVRAGAADPKPDDYDGVIVAGSIHAGGYQRPVARWVRAHLGGLESRPTAFVSVCLSILSKKPKERDEANAMPRRFVDRLGWHPTAIKIVAGALPYTKYNFFTRWLMKRIVTSAGGDTDTSRDYEYTDWRDLRDFTDRFAALVE